MKRLYVYCFECNNYIYDFEFEEIKKLADLRAAEDESIEKGSRNICSTIPLSKIKIVI